MTEAEELELLELEEREAGASSSAPKEGPGAIRSGVLGVAQGGTAGFADEIAQKLVDLFGPEQIKPGAMASPELRAQLAATPTVGNLLKERMRREADQARELHPEAYIGGEMLGATGLSLATGAVGRAAGAGLGQLGVAIPKAATGLQRVGAATAMGAGQGAVYGAGTSEAKDWTGIAKDAAIGLGVGAAGGAFGGAVGEGVRGLRGVAQRGVKSAEVDQKAASALQKSKAVGSAAGGLGGDSAATFKTFDRLKEILADPAADEALKASAQQQIESPLFQKALLAAREEYIRKAPEQLGKIQSGRAALDAANAIDVDAEAAKVLSGPAMGQIAPRAKRLAYRFIPPIVGAAMGGPAGAAAGSGLAALQGRPDLLIKNALRNPTVRHKGYGAILKLLGTEPARLGKFAGPLMKAAERGSESLASTHFVLAQRDPEYREMQEQLATAPEPQ